LAITPELQAWASEHGYHEDLQQHLDSFRDKAIAKGYQYTDWQAALRNAIRDDWACLRTPSKPSRQDRARPNPSPPPPPSPFRNPLADQFDAILRGESTRSVIEGEVVHELH